MQGDIFETHLIQNRVHEYQQSNNAKVEYWNQQRANQLRELQKYFGVLEFQGCVQLQQSCYHVSVTDKIRVKVLLEYNFPDSEAKVYSEQPLVHDLIDPNTWQIKINRNANTLLAIFTDLKNTFLRQPPRNDPQIEKIQVLKTKVKEDEIIRRLIQVDLKTLFPGIQPTQYKAIIDGTQLNEYIFKSKEYQILQQYIVELAQANEDFAKLLISNNEKIQLQKKDLIQLAKYFDDLKKQVIDKHDQCEILKKQFDKNNILNIIDQEMRSLDDQSQEKFEGVQFIASDQFENEFQGYLELRRKYHKLRIKKEKFEELL